MSEINAELQKGKEATFEVVKVSGNWVYPAAKLIDAACIAGKNVYLRMTDGSVSSLLRMVSVDDQRTAVGGTVVYSFSSVGTGLGTAKLTWDTTAGTEGWTASSSGDIIPSSASADNPLATMADIADIGKPLVWKGGASVATLNGTIEGLDNGWTYTLTDAGTLTAGNVDVEAGDEVAWTGSAWFKVGGDGGIKVLYGSSNPGGTTYPDAQDVVNAVAQGKEVIIFWNASGDLFVYRLEYMFGYAASGDDKYVFRCIEDYNQTKILAQAEGTYTWSQEKDNKIPYPSSIAAQYSDQSTYAEGDYCMYRGQLYVCNTAIATAEDWTYAHWTQTSVAAQIGNVETLLAAL